MICPNCHKEIEPVGETTSAISIVKDKDGRMQTWIEETRDIDGVLISKRVDEYGYIEGGVIDTIRQQTYDGEGSLLSGKILKHNISGKGVEIENLLTPTLKRGV